ncbi:MAG: CDP-alcohol phosphatidyltransferase family protein [Candidatus Bruticola sp.]
MSFAIVTACTCFNMFLGLLSLYLAVIGQPFWACLALLASVCFDACDGFLARKWNVASEFGAQLDSLADFASFCLAGGTLAYSWIAASLSANYSLAAYSSDYSSGLYGVIKAVCNGGWQQGGGFEPLSGTFSYAVLVVAFVYICLGGMRLARYNANTDSICPPSFFEGMPTTGAAAILSMFCLADFTATSSCRFSSWSFIMITTLIFAFLMVCRLPYPKLTKMSWLPKWTFIVPIIVALVSLPLSVYLFCGLYLISGPIFFFINKKKLTNTQAS